VKTPGRALATLALGFLALDAILLIIAGVSTGRPLFFAAAGGCALGAAVVVVAWRRFRRALDEVDEVRRQMRADAESIRALLNTHNLNN
jgi:uncharacterized membrane protein YccC